MGIFCCGQFKENRHWGRNKSEISAAGIREDSCEKRWYNIRLSNQKNLSGHAIIRMMLLQKWQKNLDLLKCQSVQL